MESRRPDWKRRPDRRHGPLPFLGAGLLLGLAIFIWATCSLRNSCYRNGEFLIFGTLWTAIKAPFRMARFGQWGMFSPRFAAMNPLYMTILGLALGLVVYAIYRKSSPGPSESGSRKVKTGHWL